MINRMDRILKNTISRKRGFLNGKYNCSAGRFVKRNMFEKKEKALSFIIPLFIRSIPEVLSWPYPIGFDPVGFYAPSAVDEVVFHISFSELLKRTSFLYIVYTLFYKLIGDPLLPSKILAPLLTGFIGYTVYIFVRGLGVKPSTAFLASILSTTYFVALRISWEMYRQMFATIFLFTIFYLETKPQTLTNKIFQAVLSFLTSWSHEFITLLLLIHKGIQALEKKNPWKILQEALLALPAALFLLYEVYSPREVALQIPVFHVKSSSTLDTFFFITGFIVYLYLPIAPLVIPGMSFLKTPQLRNWALTCLALSYLPLNPSGFDIHWYRWVILLNYPITITAAKGFELLTSSRSGKRSIARKVAFGTLVLVFVFTATYIALPPEQQWNKYFGDWNSYKQFIQTSMLQSSIPLKDIEPTIEAIKWVDSLPGNKTLVLHEAFHNWAKIYARHTNLIRIVESDLTSPIRTNISEQLLQLAVFQNNTVYTIWWTNTTWYNMPRPPPQFKLLRAFQDIAVYIYQP